MRQSPARPHEEFICPVRELAIESENQAYWPGNLAASLGFKLKTRHKIIIVDDHAIVRQGIQLLLSAQADLQVVGESSTGSDLVSLCQTLTPDLVILDLSLGESNGIDLIKKLIKNFPKLKLLVFSALEETNYAMRALKAGALGFVNKQQASTDLINAINAVLQGNKYISPAMSQSLANWVHDKDQSPSHLSLSEREFQTFQMIAAGLKTSEIADKLNISVKTVSMYRHRALLKFGLRNNSELISYAIKNNLTLELTAPPELDSLN